MRDREKIDLFFDKMCLLLNESLNILYQKQTQRSKGKKWILYVRQKLVKMIWRKKKWREKKFGWNETRQIIKGEVKSEIIITSTYKLQNI